MWTHRSTRTRGLVTVGSEVTVAVILSDVVFPSPSWRRKEWFPGSSVIPSAEFTMILPEISSPILRTEDLTGSITPMVSNP